MATFLERESQEPGSSSVDSVAADMCGSIGNLLGAASDVAAVNQPNKTNVTSPNKDQVQSGNQDKRTKVSRGEKSITDTFFLFPRCVAPPPPPVVSFAPLASPLVSSV